MSTLQTQRREDSAPHHERVSSTGSRHSNGHPYSCVRSPTSNDGARTLSSTSASAAAANLSALVPPSMRPQVSITTMGRRFSSSSESSSSSRHRGSHSAQLQLDGFGSPDSFEMGVSYSGMSPPRPSPTNPSLRRQRRRRRSSLSDVSVSTAEEEWGAATLPPLPAAVALPYTSPNRTISAADYAPLLATAENAEEAEGEVAEYVSPSLLKLARPRFGHEPAVVPPTPTFFPAEKVDSATLAEASQPSSSSATPSTLATANIGNAPVSTSSASASPLPTADVTLVSTPVAVPPAEVAGAVNTPPRPASVSTPHCSHGEDLDSPHPSADSAHEKEMSKVPSSPSQSAQPTLPPLSPPPPPLRHGAPAPVHDVGPMPPMATAPPIAPRHLHPFGALDAEAPAEKIEFMPEGPEAPAEASRRRHDHHQPSRTATTPEPAHATNNRTRSARRPTQSVQTARARAQQRRHAVSTSPHARETPVSPLPEYFPGAKRLDDDRVPLSTKFVLGTACVVGVAVVLYLGCSIYRYASVSVRETSTPAPTSRFAWARAPKTTVVSDKDAARVAREIRDRIVRNMKGTL
ncbi:hypothetical protein ABB37_03505 [Leptomonas pyrrhocoris]|uniref:Transmembrane protein n=1 Tax=Leptomonas pyrrhocoris TaxID=157538 RepID=A0A0N0VG86_LEPPY|nr:hypothetical protein ABB37_03505 [Leptomonas pyrrhocoris]KPA82438.1 hypothetical protein ABB37_03505 [Leptomonas pyrrhocoris]|eukprot:XP_015660877.1 hypothetical protein ABB37_03505 [Leptomonas pyrrhocoris]